ncbi:MAG: iron-sulfur cluster assembly scaffold protein [Candidatus Thorarchaeota archaeon]
MAIGMTLQATKKLTRQDEADALVGFSPQKIHCSNLPVVALHKAVKDHECKLDAVNIPNPMILRPMYHLFEGY